jgi:hypothetical protein
MNGRWWSLLWVPMGWLLNAFKWLFTRDWEPLMMKTDSILPPTHYPPRPRRPIPGNDEN